MASGAFYPIGELKFTDPDVYMSTYERMCKPKFEMRSSFTPGYTGHQPGIFHKIGYGSPGCDRSMSMLPPPSTGLHLGGNKPRAHVRSASCQPTLPSSILSKEARLPDNDIRMSPKSMSITPAGPRDYEFPREAPIPRSASVYCLPSFKPLSTQIAPGSGHVEAWNNRVSSPSSGKPDHLESRADGRGSGYDAGSGLGGSWLGSNNALSNATTYRRFYGTAYPVQRRFNHH